MIRGSSSACANEGAHLCVRVQVIYPVRRVQIGVRGGAGSDVRYSEGLSALLRLVEYAELVVVGVPVELAGYCLGEPGEFEDYRGVRRMKLSSLVKVGAQKTRVVQHLCWTTNMWR